MYAALDVGPVERYVSRALTTMGYDLKADFFWAGELAGRYGKIAFCRKKDHRLGNMPKEDWEEYTSSTHLVN